jgi:hypothetical protein
MLINLRGWLRENERLALRRWCFGKDVLELGCFEGLSTCNISATANGLVTVDTFDGRGTNEPHDTEEILWNNLQATSGERCPVQVHKGRSPTFCRRSTGSSTASSSTVRTITTP